MGSSSRGSELRKFQRCLKIWRYLPLAAVFPRAGKPDGAEKLGASTRRESWKWIYSLARYHIDRPEWVHAGCIGPAIFISVGVFRELGYCARPLYMPTKVSEELIRLLRSVCTRRMDYHGWTLMSGAASPLGDDPQLADFCRRVAKNIKITVEVCETGLLPGSRMGALCNFRTAPRRENRRRIVLFWMHPNCLSPFIGAFVAPIKTCPGNKTLMTGWLRRMRSRQKGLGDSLMPHPRRGRERPNEIENSWSGAVSPFGLSLFCQQMRRSSITILGFAAQWQGGRCAVMCMGSKNRAQRYSIPLSRY